MHRLQGKLLNPQSDTAKEIRKLENQVHSHNIKYFIENDPEISDEAFDVLAEKLKKLKPDSPVLFELVGEIGIITHLTPMLSIDKKYTHKDIIKWINDTKADTFLVQPKYDGMRARYQNKILATRGNGIKGENITQRFSRLKVIGKLPTKAKDPADGEIIIPLTYFNKNLAQIYKNPRNAVVGIMKSKRVKEEGIKALSDGGVHFVLYNTTYSIEVSAKKIIDSDKWKLTLEQTLKVDYPLDGIVIKVKDHKIREMLGRTQHHYKWEIAYKLPAERKWSVVLDIKNQIGRTGRVTSIAIIKPIKLSGATVTNVTLHNYEYMTESGIGIGSKVEVTRSGEVIPFITNVKNGSVKPYKPRMTCPICRQKLKINGKFLECPNSKCPSRLAQSYEYFFKVLNVEELGNKTIERLINEYKITNVTDFYDLKENKIAKLDGFGKKSAENIIQNINKTLTGNISQYQLLQALGLKEIGPATSKWIIDKYGFDKLPRLTELDIQKIKGMGPIKAKYFVDEIKNKWWIVEKLKKRGLKFKNTSGLSLRGSSWVVTGTFKNHTRKEIMEMIRQNGGEYKTSVTKDLNYIIVGDNPGRKIDKANNLNIKAITINEFINLL